MKEQVIKRLSLTLNALDSVSVRGKANLANLSGSIAMLEEVLNMLNDIEFAEAEPENK